MVKLYYWLALGLSAMLFVGEMYLSDDYYFPNLVMMAIPAVGIAISLLAISEPFVAWYRRKPMVEANRDRIFFDPWAADIGVVGRILLVGIFVGFLFSGLLLASHLETFQRFLVVNGAIGLVCQIVWALLEWRERKKGRDSFFHLWWSRYNY